MTRFDIMHRAFMHLARSHGLARHYGWQHGRRGEIESVAHEIAHIVDLGLPLVTTPEIGSWIRAFSDRRADEHEIRVQRIEIAAMRKLGFRVGARGLRRETDWRQRRPAHSRYAKPLSRRERSAVGKFLAVYAGAALAAP